jgi:hypothetical protein
MSYVICFCFACLLVSYKRQELLTLQEHPGSPLDFGRFRVAHLFSFLLCLSSSSVLSTQCLWSSSSVLSTQCLWSSSSLLSTQCLVFVLCLEYPMSLVFVLCLEYLMLWSSSTVLNTQCLWSVHSWLPFQFSLTFVLNTTFFIVPSQESERSYIFIVSSQESERSYIFYWILELYQQCGIFLLFILFFQRLCDYSFWWKKIGFCFYLIQLV